MNGESFGADVEALKFGRNGRSPDMTLAAIAVDLAY
jgi:hypothetical protein